MEERPQADFRAARLRTRIHLLALAGAILIATAIPAVYLTVVYVAQKEALAFQARLAAGQLARYAYANGPLWVFHVHRLDDLLASVQNPKLRTSQRIEESKGAVIHEQGPGCRVPAATVAEDIVVNGAGIGRVVICEDFAPFLWRALAFLALGAVLGAFTYLSVKWLPVSALDRTLAELAGAYHRLRSQAAETARAHDLLQTQHRLIEDTVDALAHARDDAMLANKSKTEFLANMSHELRTPLNAIIGFSEMMRTEAVGALPEHYKAYAVDINESGRHLLSLVDDLLDVSRIEAGKVALSPQLIDLRDLLAACGRMIRERMIKARVTFDEVLGATPALVSGDATRLKQVFLNLLSNAVKFTPAGGRIEVLVRVEAAQVQVIVSDNGSGMRPDEIPRALGGFRHGGAFVRAKGGVGLGLPIAKTLVELHQGSLTLESAPGAGTCATVTLAVASATALHPVS